MNYIKNYSITFNASSLEFQSTPSVGRATLEGFRFFLPEGISIHALRGEGDAVRQFSICRTAISIHALRGEGDNISGLTG